MQYLTIRLLYVTFCGFLNEKDRIPWRLLWCYKCQKNFNVPQSTYYILECFYSFYFVCCASRYDRSAINNISFELSSIKNRCKLRNFVIKMRLKEFSAGDIANITIFHLKSSKSIQTLAAKFQTKKKMSPKKRVSINYSCQLFKSFMCAFVHENK